jgi:hypothetical protein
LKEVLSNSVTVRQVPFIEMLSPSPASSRILPHSEIVRDVPPPPEVVESRDERFVTALMEMPSVLYFHVRTLKGTWRLTPDCLD